MIEYMKTALIWLAVVLLLSVAYWLTVIPGDEPDMAFVLICYYASVHVAALAVCFVTVALVSEYEKGQ